MLPNATDFDSFDAKISALQTAIASYRLTISSADSTEETLRAEIATLEAKIIRVRADSVRVAALLPEAESRLERLIKARDVLNAGNAKLPMSPMQKAEKIASAVDALETALQEIMSRNGMTREQAISALSALFPGKSKQAKQTNKKG